MLHVEQWGQEFFQDLPNRKAARTAAIKQLESNKLEQQAKKENAERELQINERHQQMVKAAINRINLPYDLRMIGERIGRADLQIYSFEAKYAELNGLIRQDSLREKVIKAINDLRVFEQDYHGLMNREAELNVLLQQQSAQRHTMSSQHRKLESELQHAKDQIKALQEQPPSSERDSQINNLQRYIPVYLQSQSLIKTNLLPIDEKIAQDKLELKNIQDQKAKLFQQKQEAEKWVGMASPDLLQKAPANHDVITGEIESLRKKIANERLAHAADKALYAQTKQLLVEAELCQIGEYQSCNIDQLQQMYMVLPTQQKEKQEFIKQCDANVAQLDAQIAVLQHEQTEDNARIHEMERNEWMINYHRNPGKLIEQLRDEIDTCLTDYEHKHPANQSEAVRILLREWQNIRVMREMRETQYFHQLLAWLNHASQEIATLQEIAGRQAIQVKDEVTFHRINHEELQALELEEYNRAMEQLTLTINDMPQDSPKIIKNLYQSARLVVKEVDEYYKRENRAQKTVFDKKYYTNILNSIDTVLHNPVNLENQNHYRHLIEFNNSGRSSLEYKLNAALLCCLGAMIIAASILTMLLTAFIVTPLAMTTIAIGAAMITGAGGFVIAGRQKGVDRALTKMNSKIRLFKPEEEDELHAAPPLLVFK